MTAAAREEPAFFFDFAIPRAKLAFARFWIFGLLAVDAVMQLGHAPRYGAGGFNVAHVAFLDDAAPGRVVVGFLYLVLAYLFAAIAVGAGSRVLVAITAAIYGWIYVTSQLDSYQHHYLVALFLVLAAAVPWFRAPDEPRDAAHPVRSWALRLILIQLGIVYVWAALAKIDDAWLDGSALEAQLSGGAVRSLIDSTVGFKVTAGLMILVELFLAAAIWCRPLWRFAWPIGVVLHVGIAFTNLEIGLFSWIMVALYVLVIPDGWFLAAWRALRLGALGARLREVVAVGPPWLVAGVLAVLAGVCLVAGHLPIDGALGAAVVAVILVVVTDAMRIMRPVARLGVWPSALAGGVLVLVLGMATDVVSDYYRFWGGSARRLGDRATARYAYGRMVEVAPDEAGGHYQLGKLLLTGPDADEARGLAELDRAAVLEPRRARAPLEQARYLMNRGRREEAMAAARAAVVAEPNHPQARELLERFEHATAEERVRRPTPDDDIDDDLSE